MHSGNSLMLEATNDCCMVKALVADARLRLTVAFPLAVTG